MILFIFLQIFLGIGLLRTLNYTTTIFKFLSLSLIWGIVIMSSVPFLLQLAYIPITEQNIIILTSIFLVLLNIIPVIRYIKYKIAYIDFKIEKFSLYEIPGIAFMLYIIYIPAWRSFNIPNNSRDILSGPEPLSEMALKEHTLINSIFNLDLFSTNNQYKSPFILDLQIIYKMAGFQYGGLWLGFMGIAFSIFLYCILKEKMHALLASILICIIVITPEIYGYTMLFLFDYPNMVLWTIGTYYLYKHINNNGSKTHLYIAAISYMFATYIRAETFILVCMITALYFILVLIKRFKLSQIILFSGLILLLSFIGYYIPTEIYNNHYLPQDYKIGTLMNDNITNFAPLFERLDKIINTLLIGEWGKNYHWLHTIELFLIFFVIEIVFNIITKQKISINWIFWLGATIVIFIGLPIIGFLLPLMDVEHSTKRAMTKIIPMMYIFITHFNCVAYISKVLYKWEYTKIETKSKSK